MKTCYSSSENFLCMAYKKLVCVYPTSQLTEVGTAFRTRFLSSAEESVTDFIILREEKKEKKKKERKKVSWLYDERLSIINPACWWNGLVWLALRNMMHFLGKNEEHIESLGAQQRWAMRTRLVGTNMSSALLAQKHVRIETVSWNQMLECTLTLQLISSNVGIAAPLHLTHCPIPRDPKDS